ncbi:MAG: M18 family aminopeptidase [Acidimicrobiia bacterium]|nr:M18 family aminopeptidase [Acidimicrobiia bacterium]
MDTLAARAHLDDLARYLVAAPSPFHAVAESARRLEDAGFVRLDEGERWVDPLGRRYTVRGGALVAWDASAFDPTAGMRIVGAHTDSPNLRLRPRPDRHSVGFAQLGVEVYGSPLLNSWLDRDLGLSGRVARRGSDGPVLVDVLFDEPLLRIPQLAIHLDRTIGAEGLRLDPQRHIVPVWSTGDAPDFRHWLAARLGVGADEILSWDLMTHDLTPPAVLGVDGSMFAAGRLDNLLSCHAAVTALADGEHDGSTLPMIALFDHEEVGSVTASGAAGEVLTGTIERLLHAAGLDVEARRVSMARSVCLSADGAHATHPNWPERHEPDHMVLLDGGPVLKSNAMARYATDARGAALVDELAARLAIDLQHFVSRNDMPCGSTIGPVTATRSGITTVDVGVAQLSMHSARELTGVLDPYRFRLLLGAFLRDDTAVR